MRRLIVNADDLGLSRERNAGIAEAVRARAVASVSLLANLDGFDDAVATLRELPRVDVGLHFNISEGRPIAASPRSLVDEAGRFFGKGETRARALAGRLEAAEIGRELEAQVARLRAAGIDPSHVDGHQHLHVYGPVAAAVARAAARCGLRWTRLPSEPARLSDGLPIDRRSQIDEYRALSEAAREAFEAAGLRAPGHFRGLALSGRMTAGALAALVAGLPEGTTELMVHPGRASAPSGFEGPDREAELAALVDPAFRRALDEGGVALGRRESLA